MIAFLRDKLKNWNLRDLIWAQLEGFLQWLVMYLPAFPGMLVRWFFYRFCFQKLSGFCWIQPNVQFVHMNRIRLGRNVGINSGTYINGFGGVEMGDFVLIGSNVTISSGQHPIDGPEPTVFERPCLPKKIVLEDGVWIGAGAVIMPGITLGKGTVVGANSVVTKNTEPFSVVVGAPARKVRSR